MSGSKLIFLILFAVVLAGRHAHAVETNVVNLAPSHSDFKNLTGKGRFKLGGEGFSEGLNDGLAAYWDGEARITYTFAPWLQAKIAPRIKLFTSRLQQQYDTDTYKSKLVLQNAYLDFMPTGIFGVKVGALDQAFLECPMLVSRHRAFPGVQEIYRSGADNAWSMQIVFQQAVPTSYSLDTQRESKEPWPLFETESLHLNGRADWLDWKAFGGHYRWSDLPDSVAFNSFELGNMSNDAEAAPGSRFQFDFDGVFWGGEACYCGTGRTQFTIETQGMVNGKAASAAAKAQMWGLGPTFHFGRRQLDLRLRHYFIESDATVAAYNWGFLGHNNRIGDNIEAKLNFDDLKFAIVAGWVNARTLVDLNAIQKTMTGYYLGVETHYAAF